MAVNFTAIKFAAFYNTKCTVECAKIKKNAQSIVQFRFFL